MFEKGDYVLYVNDVSNGSDRLGLELGKIYMVSKVYEGNFLYIEGMKYVLHPARFRKLKKVADTKIARAICKVYKEEDGYIYV